MNKIILITDFKNQKSFLIKDLEIRTLKSKLESSSLNIKEIQELYSKEKEFFLFKELTGDINLLSKEFNAKIIEVPKLIDTNYFKNKISGVYIIKNNYHKKFYIGSTKDFRARYYSHRHTLLKNSHPCEELQKDFNEVGREYFNFSVLQEVNDLDDLLKIESQFISKYENEGYTLYNCNFKKEGKTVYTKKGKTSIKKFTENLRKTKGKSLISINIETGEMLTFSCAKEASEYLNLDRKRIFEVLKGYKNNGKTLVQKTNYKGYIFRYQNEGITEFKKEISKIGNIISVYAIINKTNNKYCVLSSIDTNARIGRHKYYFENSKTGHINEDLFNDVKTLGLDNFEFKILEECSKEELASKEAYWKEFYKTNLY